MFRSVMPWEDAVPMIVIWVCFIAAIVACYWLSRPWLKRPEKKEQRYSKRLRSRIGNKNSRRAATSADSDDPLERSR